MGRYSRQGGLQRRSSPLPVLTYSNVRSAPVLETPPFSTRPDANLNPFWRTGSRALADRDHHQHRAAFADGVELLFQIAAVCPVRRRPACRVRLTAPDGYRAQRSYSIASAPETTDHLELAIEKLENGEVSPFFHEVAAVGDEIDLSGPIGGHFIWTAADGGPMLMIGGGAGVVPFMSMIRHRTLSGSAAPMLLLFSARTREDLLFADELSALRDRRDGFDLVATLTREASPPAGVLKGRIDANMIAGTLASAARQAEADLYLRLESLRGECGPARNRRRRRAWHDRHGTVRDVKIRRTCADWRRKPRSVCRVPAR